MHPKIPYIINTFSSNLIAKKLSKFYRYITIKQSLILLESKRIISKFLLIFQLKKLFNIEVKEKKKKNRHISLYSIFILYFLYLFLFNILRECCVRFKWICIDFPFIRLTGRLLHIYRKQQRTNAINFNKLIEVRITRWL